MVIRDLGRVLKLNLRKTIRNFLSARPRGEPVAEFLAQSNALPRVQILSATISTTSGVIINAFGFFPAPAKSARTLSAKV